MSNQKKAMEVSTGLSKIHSPMGYPRSTLKVREDAG
jgi:hypothetical protein